MRWVKARRCDSATCVEVAIEGEQIWVRNSQAPQRLVRFTRQEWLVFLEAVRRGEFDT